MHIARYEAAVAVVEDKIYAIGGTTKLPAGPESAFFEGTQTSAVEVYTPFGYVTLQATATPSSSPESSQPALPEATAVIVGVVVGAVIAATTILVYRHKHLKTAKQNKPSKGLLF